jgi:hypothetical protein
MLALLATHLAAFVHETTTRHARCAEHGEVLHAASAPTASFPPAPQRDAAAERVVTSADSSDGPHHDHCQVAFALGQSIIMPPHFSSVARATRSLQHSLGSPGATGTLVTVIYRAAPKTSPPA